MQTNVVIPDELKPFLDWMISPNQIAFVEGRWINEDFVLAQEAVLTMNKTKSKQGWLGLKIDFPKAFDRMEWNFIEWIKKKKRFPLHLHPSDNPIYSNLIFFYHGK